MCVYIYMCIYVYVYVSLRIYKYVLKSFSIICIYVLRVCIYICIIIYYLFFVLFALQARCVADTGFPEQKQSDHSKLQRPTPNLIV